MSVTRQFCTDTTILLQKPAEPAFAFSMAESVAVMMRRGAAFSMAEPVAVMMRRGEEEDEEGAVATTSPLEVPKPGLNPASSKPNIGVSSPAPGPGLDPRAA